MGALDKNIRVTVVLEAAPIEGTNFGRPLYLALPAEFGGGFTERVRLYADADGVNTDVASGDITSALGDRLKLALQQSPRVDDVALGRLSAGANDQEVTIAFTGNSTAAGENHTIRIGAAVVTYATLAAAETPATISAALEALLTAELATAGVNATAVDNGGSITVTADSTSDFFDYSVFTDSPSTADTITVNDAGLDLVTDFAAIRAENDDFYGVALQSRATAHNLALAAEIEALGSDPINPEVKLFLPQSRDLDILEASASADFFSQLIALSYVRTSGQYRAADDLDLSLALLATKLETNLDIETTTWAYATLEGIPAEDLTATQLATLEAKRGNNYGLFYKSGTNYGGVLPTGNYIDERTSADWITVRSAERLATVLLATSNRNSKIPYTDRGIAVLASEVRGVGKQGEEADHFVTDTFQVIKPLASEVPAAIKASRKLFLKFSATLSGAIQEVDISGFVAVA